MNLKSNGAVKKIGRILIVDDDRFYQELCRDVLSAEGYQVDSSFTGEEALVKLKFETYQILIVDLVLPGLDGLKVLAAGKQSSPSTDFIFVTGYGTVESAVTAMKMGASDYLTKPINPEELKLSVKRCIELRGMFEENIELKGLIKLYNTIQLVSNTLDLDQLYSLSLDSVLQGIDAQGGVALFRTGEGSKSDHFVSRGISEEDSHSLVAYIEKKYVDKKHREIKVIANHGDFPKLKGKIGANALLIPILGKATRGVNFIYDGLILAWKDAEFSEKELSNVRFITEQIGRSLENAVDFRGAQDMVFVDDLSGLFNMRYLNVSLDNELKRAKRFKKGLALLFIDLDHFKNINDAHGHLSGSKMLKEASVVIKNCIREIDIAIRYGGDEFIVILTDTDVPGSLKVAERIRANMQGTVFLQTEKINARMTCCVGIANYPEDADNKVDLIHLADKAMYRGKESTRNCVYSATDIK